MGDSEYPPNALTVRDADDQETAATVDDRKESGSRKHLKPDELIRALIMHDSGLSCRKIAEALGRHHSTISAALAGLQDTRNVAKQVLRAGSLTLAQRVVDQAAPREAIDVLSRPDIGVLEPPAQRGGGTAIQVNMGAVPPGIAPPEGWTPGASIVVTVPGSDGR